LDELFDEAYLQSFEINPKLKEDMELQCKNLRNPNIQKQFKEYFFDRDKLKNVGRTASTSGSK